MMRILIVDYGMANLRSVQKGFEKVGHAAVITANPNDLTAADKLVVPGVGAFCDASARLREAGWVEPIRDHIAAGRPFLGICLGLQLLFDRSFEDGEFPGLGVVSGDVVRLADAPGRPVPHMGWNQLRFRRPGPLLVGVPDGADVYFVHCYVGVPSDPSVIAAETDYPDPFAAVLWRDNLFATQFHPEKSQHVGQTMLRNFGEL
jgi:imidazole glycerol-phosphate synthase subunit HisH